MSAARALAGFVLVLSAATAAAQPPLLIGVLQSDDTEPVLRLALRSDKGQWSGLDSLTGEQARNTGFPPFASEEKKPATVTLDALRSALFDAGTALETWYGAGIDGRPLQRRALRAEQGRWSCTRAWGLRLDRRSGAGDAWTVFANQPAEVRYFQPAAAVAVDGAPYEPATPAQQQAALKAFRDTDPTAPAPAAELPPWHAVTTERLALEDGGALVAVSALRALRVPGKDEDNCAAPVMVATALFRIQSDGKTATLDNDVSVQRCDDAGEPSPQLKPWALVRSGGEAVLLQWQLGDQVQRLGVYRLSPQTLAPSSAAAATGGESGC